MNKLMWLILGWSVWVVPSLWAESVRLRPAADTTLFEPSPGNNLGGQFDLAAGTTREGKKTRGLLRFDLEGAIPDGAVITNASLSLRVTRLPATDGVASTFALHRMLQSWTEGTNGTPVGGAAAAGETTWLMRHHPATPWAEPGGKRGEDFAATASSGVAVAGRGVYGFLGTPELLSDLARWRQEPEKNWGWLLLSEMESVPETARRFGTREGEDAPELLIEYRREASPFRIVKVTVERGSGTVEWTGGTPPFQLQGGTDVVVSGWRAVGEPTSVRSASFPADGRLGIYRVVEVRSMPQEETAQYEVVFESRWTPATHPQDYPARAHWSPLIGGTHNEHVTFWGEQALASAGIKDMAELGSIAALRSEVNAAIGAKTADQVIFRPGSIPGSGAVTLTMTVQRDFPRVTLVTMLAPSPDWFVGVQGIALSENGVWVDRRSYTLELYDAGTDSGRSYDSRDEETQPRELIRRITGFPALVDGQIVPFATMTFQRKGP